MDIRQLKSLVAVVEEEGFGRAADRLHVAQSALSRQILLLEDEVGSRLLERNKRSPLRLTEAGTLFLAAARSAIEHFERAEQVGRRLGRGELGRVKIGYVASAIFASLLPAATTDYRRRWPDAEIEAIEMESPRQMEALAGGEIDIGFFRPQPVCPANVETVTLLREPVILALHRDHPLARTGRPLPPRELADCRFVVPQSDDAAGFARHAATIARLGGFPLKVSQRVHDFITVLNLVGLGFGIAAVPDCLRRVQPAEIAYRPLADCAVWADLAGGFRRDERSAAIRNFIGVMRRLAHRSISPG